MDNSHTILCLVSLYFVLYVLLCGLFLSWLGDLCSLSLSHRLKSFGVGKKMLHGMQLYGIQLLSMLKEGRKDLYGLNEAVLKNIDSCKQLSNITRTSLSPNGTNKMVIDPLDKLYKQMMLPLLTSCSQDFGFSRQGSTRRYRRWS